MTPDISTPLPRRTIAKGAAWAAPVITIAAAAPVASASGPTGPTCQGTTSFDSLTLGTKPAMIQFLPSAITANLTYGKSPAGVDMGPTGQVKNENVSWKYIALQMNARSAAGGSYLVKGDKVTMTLQFSAPVENLSITIHDIDKQENAWNDLVHFDTPPTSVTNGSNVKGTGTSGDPLQAKAWGNQTTGNGTERSVVTWADPITMLTITYEAGGPSSSNPNYQYGNSQNQWVAIGNISFNSCVTP